MKLFIGLGNPGKEYENTRHNVGFMVIDKLSHQLSIPLSHNKFNGIYGKGKYKGEDVILLQPQTYMNNSGECVQLIMKFFKINKEDIIVIYDDLDLPTGKLRLRISGSAGGHNGIKSMIQHVGDQNFNRIKVGIDRSKVIAVVDYVLGKFSKDEADEIERGINLSVDACVEILVNDFVKAMNKFN